MGNKQEPRTQGRDDRLFIRPDSPLKLFTGQTASRQSFAADVEFMGFYEFPPSSLIVVSSPKRLLKEWRFVIVQGKVIADSQYMVEGELAVEPAYDRKAFDLAQTVASRDDAPDPVWVLDICQTADNDYRLLEIGAFSFASLYACDKRDVVAAVSDAAISIWRSSKSSN